MTALFGDQCLAFQAEEVWDTMLEQLVEERLLLLPD
jgi:hypothetical protein